MQRDLPSPELPAFLRLPQYKVLIPLFGLLNLMFALPGGFLFFCGKIQCIILEKIFGPVFPLITSILLKLAPTFFINPNDSSPMKAFVILVGMVYPALLWNILSPFAFNFATFGRVLVYCMTIVAYGVEYEGLGLGHLEAHAYWIKGGGIVKPEWRWLFDRFGEHFYCPLVGISPGMPTYTHCLVHHKFGNNLEDPQSTLWYDRSSLFQFIFYYCPTMLYNRHWAFGAVRKMYEYGQDKYAESMSYGINRLLFIHGMIALLSIKFYLLVFLPMGAFNTMAVSGLEWAMHAFLDPDDVNCTPTLATPILSTGGDDYRLEPYHLIHHAFNTGYYTKEDKKLEKTQFENYVKNRDNQETTPLFIFDMDKIYGHGKWSWPQFFKFIFTGDVKGLVDVFVWSGKGPRPSNEELEKFLKRCMSPLDITKYSMERLKAQQLVGPADLKDKKAMKLTSDN